jgi:ferrochelatase
VSETQRPVAVLLMAMGGPDRLENVEAYLMDVRSGRAASPELVEEIRTRYRLTGGKSPVLEITREVATALEQRLNRPAGERYRCYVGLRHWHPFIKETYAKLLEDFPERVVALCMAPQYSSLSIGAYVKKVEEARSELASEAPISFVTSWHRHPLLIASIADNVHQTLQTFPSEIRSRVPILFTAHSLPERVVAMKDPYPEEVRGTVQAICEQLGSQPTRFAYQSQGRSGEKWLGPSVEQMLIELADEGHRHVLVAPIGFICDHVETLYDIDIELRQLARTRGMRLERIPMLNASPSLIDIVTSVIETHESSLVH